jgi:hypothetical protein
MNIQIEISFLTAKHFPKIVTKCNKQRECKLKITDQTANPTGRIITFTVESDDAKDFYQLGKEFVLAIDNEYT